MKRNMSGKSSHEELQETHPNPATAIGEEPATVPDHHDPSKPLLPDARLKNPAVPVEKPRSYLEAQARAGGRFRVVSDFEPQGDQAQAIEKLSTAYAAGGTTRSCSA